MTAAPPSMERGNKIKKIDGHSFDDGCCSSYFPFSHLSHPSYGHRRLCNISNLQASPIIRVSGIMKRGNY